MIHPPGCECEAYACRLRAKGVQISTAALPSRHNRKAPPQMVPPDWNKTIVGETRPGGGFMPYIHADGEPYRNREFAEKRRELTNTRRALANKPEEPSSG